MDILPLIKILYNLFSGTYFLEITDSVGCIFYDTIIVNKSIMWIRSF